MVNGGGGAVEGEETCNNGLDFNSQATNTDATGEQTVTFRSVRPAFRGGRPHAYSAAAAVLLAIKARKVEVKVIPGTMPGDIYYRIKVNMQY